MRREAGGRGALARKPLTASRLHLAPTAITGVGTPVKVTSRQPAPGAGRDARRSQGESVTEREQVLDLVHIVPGLEERRGAPRAPERRRRVRQRVGRAPADPRLQRRTGSARRQPDEVVAAVRCGAEDGRVALEEREGRDDPGRGQVGGVTAEHHAGRGRRAGQRSLEPPPQVSGPLRCEREAREGELGQQGQQLRARLVGGDGQLDRRPRRGGGPGGQVEGVLDEGPGQRGRGPGPEPPPDAGLGLAGAGCPGEDQQAAAFQGRSSGVGTVPARGVQPA